MRSTPRIVVTGAIAALFSLGPVVAAASAQIGSGGAGRSCDFTHGGFAALATPAPGKQSGGAKAAGAVGVVYGSASGLQAVGSQTLTAAELAPLGDVAQPGDALGTALACGDWN